MPILAILLATSTRYRRSHIYHKAEVSYIGKIEVTHKTTKRAQNGHRFQEHTHTVKHVTVEQLARCFCGGSDSTLQQDVA